MAVRALLDGPRPRGDGRARRPRHRHVQAVRGGVPLVLQLLRAGAWKAVAHSRTTAGSTFRLVYTAHPGVVQPARALRRRRAQRRRGQALPALFVS